MKIVVSGSDPKNDQVLGYIIAALKGDLGRTKLVKLCYLADLYSRMVRGRGISSLRYRLFPNGPFDGQMHDSIRALQHAGYIEEKFFDELEGYRYTIKKHVGTDRLNQEDRFILDQVLREYGDLSLEFLLDEVVYKTEPVRKAKELNAIKAPIDMDCVNNKLNAKTGLDFETYVKSLDAIERGERISLDDLLNAL